MKIKITLLLSLLTLFTFSYAQNEEGSSVVTAGVGYSLFNNIITTGLEAFDDVEVSGVPTIAVTYDYAITDNFSIGLAAAHQSAGGEFSNTFLNDDLNEVTETAKTTVSRTNVAIRPLLHYGGNDQLDLYSGLRVGMLFRSIETESTDPDIDVLGDFNGSRFSLGLVVFGMRYFFTDNVGINADLQLGTPYVVSGGVAIKF